MRSAIELARTAREHPDADEVPAARCEALEVLGRVERETDYAAALPLFTEAAQAAVTVDPDDGEVAALADAWVRAFAALLAEDRDECLAAFRRGFDRLLSLQGAPRRCRGTSLRAFGQPAVARASATCCATSARRPWPTAPSVRSRRISPRSASRSGRPRS